MAAHTQGAWARAVSHQCGSDSDREPNGGGCVRRTTDTRGTGTHTHMHTNTHMRKETWTYTRASARGGGRSNKHHCEADDQGMKRSPRPPWMLHTSTSEYPVGISPLQSLDRHRVHIATPASPQRRPQLTPVIDDTSSASSHAAMPCTHHRPRLLHRSSTIDTSRVTAMTR